MFARFHIHRFGKSLCHINEGLFINIEEAPGMNRNNCCNECLHRYVNLAEMCATSRNDKPKIKVY